jgi:transposase InsO family protein
MLQRPVESAQYTSIAFGRRCLEAGVRPSMGSVGDCFDNAMCESFFATLECELLARCRFQTHDQARHAIFEYLESWYNLRRRHSGLGYRSPAIFEDTYRAKTQHSPEPVASCPPPASVMVVRGDPPAGRGQLSSGI